MLRIVSVASRRAAPAGAVAVRSATLPRTVLSGAMHREQPLQTRYAVIRSLSAAPTPLEGPSSNALFDEVDRVFHSKSCSDEQYGALASLLMKHPDSLTRNQFVTMSACFRYGTSLILSPPRLDFLTAAVQTLSTLPPLSASQIAETAYGLHTMSTSDEITRKYVALLTKHANIEIERGVGKLNSRRVFYLLFSMRNMTERHGEEVGQWADAVGKLIESSDVTSLDSVGVAKAVNGFRGLTTDLPQVRRLLAILTPLVENSPPILPARDVAVAIKGLKCMSSNAQESRDLLRVLTAKIERATNCDIQCIDQVLTGLRCMSTSAPEVRELLRVLAVLLESLANPSRLECRSILHRTKLLEADIPETQMFVNALAKKLNVTPENLYNSDKSQQRKQDTTASKYISPERNNMTKKTRRASSPSRIRSPESVKSHQEFSELVRSFHRKKADTKEIQDQLIELSVKLIQLKGNPSPKFVRNVLYGLNSMGSDVAEVRHFLSVLKPTFKTITEPMSSKDFCLALYGFRHMTSEAREVQNVLSALENFGQQIPSISGKDLVLALEGLQRMDASDAGVAKIVSICFDKASESSDLLQGPQFGDCLCAVCEHFPSALPFFVQKLLPDFRLFVDGMMKDESTIDKVDLRYVCQRVLVTKGVLEDLISTSKSEGALDLNLLRVHREFVELAEAVLSKTDFCLPNKAEDFPNKTRSVDKISSLLDRALHGSQHVKVSCKESLCGVLSGIVVRVYSSDVSDEASPEVVVNIEMHEDQDTVCFQKYRDQYLEEKHNIIVIRLDEAFVKESSSRMILPALLPRLLERMKSRSDVIGTTSYHQSDLLEAIFTASQRKFDRVFESTRRDKKRVS